MNYLFFGLIMAICLFSIKNYPGVVLAYLLLFQKLNKVVFDQVGLSSLRYVTSIGFFLLIFLLHNKRKIVKKNLRNLIKNRIALGYYLLISYMLFYTIFLGSSYEVGFIKSFFLPGVLLFVASGMLFFNEEMYREFFYGIIIFSISTFIFLNIFNEFSVLRVVERTEIGSIMSFGVITQGRMAGMLAIFALMIMQFEKGNLLKFGIALLILSLYWLASTGTRGALVSLIVTFLFFLLCATEGKISKKTYLTIGIIVVPILLYLGIFDSPLFNRTSTFMNPSNIQSMQRYYRWILFFDLLPDNILFGLGPGGWGKYVMIGGNYRFPHNSIIEFVLDYGLIGIVSFSLIFINCIKLSVTVLRDPMKSIYFKTLTLSWVFYATNTMFSGGFIRGNINFFTLTGIIVGLSVFLSNQNLPQN